MHRSSIPSGGARRDRTDDLMLAKHALSQLSYGPVPEDECFKLDERHIRSIKVVGLGRLELPTSRLSSARSNQLSYKPLTSKYPPAKPGAYMRLRKSRVFLAAFCPSDNCLCQGRRAFGCLHSWHDGPSLLGRAERSTPEARRVAPQARGVDGESARRAIIVVQWIASRGVLPSPSRDASRASS